MSRQRKSLIRTFYVTLHNRTSVITVYTVYGLHKIISYKGIMVVIMLFLQ
jgi:hypothetical protein